MKLGENEIEKLEFNIADRKLTVYHWNNDDAIEIALDQLDLGSKKISTDDIGNVEFESHAVAGGAPLGGRWRILRILGSHHA